MAVYLRADPTEKVVAMALLVPPLCDAAISGRRIR
jgi:hypothetical protein